MSIFLDKTYKRIKLLRTAHCLQGKQVADLFGIAYRNYLKYENGGVSVDSSRFVYLSRYFGVSANWLLGITDQPYEKTLLEQLEKEIWHINDEGDLELRGYGKLYGQQVNAIFYPFKGTKIIDEYSNPNKRDKIYSPEVRGNIIFLLNRYMSLITSIENLPIKDEGKDPYYLDIEPLVHADCVQSLMEYGIGIIPDMAMSEKQKEIYINRAKKALYKIVDY